MSELDICRICLESAVKGCKLDKYNLRRCYEFIVQEKVSSEDLLPQWACYECVALLHKFHKFKEKCIRGQMLLKVISMRDIISYDSIAQIDRCRENLVSSFDIVKASANVQTIFIKYKQIEKSTEIEPEAMIFMEALKEKGEFYTHNVTKTINIDIKNTNNDMGSTDHIDQFTSNDEKTCDELIKSENKSEEDIMPSSLKLSSNLLVKFESDILDCHETDDVKIRYTSKSNNLVTKNDVKNLNNCSINNSDLENTKYDSDANFDVDNNVKSSDDEALFDIAKKRKRKQKNDTKIEDKHKKSIPNREKEAKKDTKLKKTQDKKVVLKNTKHKKFKAYKDDEVVFKNTKPKKLVLNPQFWKKTNLSEEEALREFKQREYNNDYYLKAKFKCQDCFKGFSKNEMLERHQKQRHDESIGDKECRFCHMRFRHRHQLEKHIKEHFIIYNCLLCKLRCSRLSTAITHQEHHKGIKKTCIHCGKEFNHLSTYYTHVRMSHRSAHVCVACGASFVSEHGLLLHTKFMHIDSLKQLEDDMRKRREANKSETTEPATEQVNDTEEIYCAKCDIRFMSRSAYNLHFFKSDNHDEADADAAGVDGVPVRGQNSRAKIPTTCPHCGLKFPTQVAYKRHHLAQHPHVPLNLPKKRDICEVCGASVQMGSIQYHMKSHTGEREFVCPAPDCELRFTLKRNMKRHYNVKHLGIPSPKYVRRNPTKRRKKTQEILENDISPFVRSRTAYFL